MNAEVPATGKWDKKVAEENIEVYINHVCVFKI
jgi:hypothetical protein